MQSGAPPYDADQDPSEFADPDPDSELLAEAGDDIEILPDTFDLDTGELEEIELRPERGPMVRALLPAFVLVAVVSAAIGAGVTALAMRDDSKSTSKSAAGSPSTTADGEATAIPTTAGDVGAGSPTAAGSAPAIVLGVTGIGIATFGETEDDVVAKISRVLGPADGDSADEACSEPNAKLVSWRGLELIFRTKPGKGRIFDAWTYFEPTPPAAHIEPRLRTTSSVTLGSTVADLKARYTDKLVLIPNDPQQATPAFELKLDNGLEFGGDLTSVEDDGVVLDMSGGPGCQGA